MKRVVLALAAILVCVTSAFALSGAQRAVLWQSPTTIHDGISLDFTKSLDSCCYVKPPGQPAQRNSFQNLFTFTRNSPDATFLAANGLIQYANENRILQSQTFQTTWNNDGAAGDVAADVAIAPDGTLTADMLTKTADNNVYRYETHILQAGRAYTFRVFVKKGTGTPDWAYVGDATNLAFTYVNVSTCALGATLTANTVSRSATTFGNGWCQVIITVRATGFTTFIATVRNTNGDGTTSATNFGLGEGHLWWGAQLQAGNAAGIYLPTTTIPKYDQPRIEYDTSGALLGLLMEGSRINAILQSEDFTTTWVNTNTTDAANTAVSPDGNTTADTVTASGANGTIAQNFAGQSTNVVRVFSVYLKRLTGTGTVTTEIGRTSATCTLSVSVWNRCVVADTGLNGTYAVVTNVVTVTAVGHGLNTGDAARLDYTSGTAADFDCTSVTVLTADTFTCAQTTGNTTGNITVYANLGRIKIATNADAVYAWGGQGEAPAANPGFASSYIPTTTATVTRQSDSAVHTLGLEYATNALTMIATWQTFNVPTGQFATLAVFDDGGTNNRNAIFRNNSGGNAGLTITGGASQANIATTGGPATVRTKSAYGATGADFSYYADGVFIGAVSVGTMPTVTVLRVGIPSYGSDNLFGWVLRFDQWPTRQPNSFLQQKTFPGPQSALTWPHYAANDNAVEKAA